MNNQNLLLESLSKSEYNLYLKPFYFDLQALSKDHPDIVIELANSATSKDSLCRYLSLLLLGIHPYCKLDATTAYFLTRLYSNYRPTPPRLDNTDE